MSDIKNTFKFLDESGRTRQATEIINFHLLDTGRDYIIYELEHDNKETASIHFGILEKTDEGINISDIGDKKERDIVMKAIKNMALEGDK